MLRIAVLGDSFTEALEVPLEQTFVSVLEESLNRSGAARGRHVEVLNFGVRGYGTAQELLTLRCCVWDYSPDFVLLAFFAGNDVVDNSPTLDISPTHYARPYFRKTSAGWETDRSFRASWRYRVGKVVAPLVAHSRVLQLIIRGQHVLGRTRPPAVTDAMVIDTSQVGPGVYREPIDEAWRDAWRTTEDLLTTMSHEVSERGARFAVFNVPMAAQVYPDSGLRQRLCADWAWVIYCVQLAASVPSATERASPSWILLPTCKDTRTGTVPFCTDFRTPSRGRDTGTLWPTASLGKTSLPGWLV